MPGPYTFPTDRVTGGPDPAADVNALAAALNEATDETVASTLILRDESGRAKVGTAPSSQNDDTIASTGFVHATAVTKNFVDAKGDILVGSSDDTVVRLPVGPNGTVLRADSAETSGVKWAAGAGAWKGQYVPPIGDSFTSSFIFAASSVHLRGGNKSYMPLLLGEPISFDQVSFRLNTVADAGTVGGIFLGELIGNDFVEMNGGVAIVAGIPLDTATVGVVTYTITPIALQADKVYGFNLRQTTGSGFAVRIASGKMGGPGIDGAQGNNWDQLGLSPDFTTGLAQYIPLIKIRRSA